MKKSRFVDGADVKPTTVFPTFTDGADNSMTINGNRDRKAAMRYQKDNLVPIGRVRTVFNNKFGTPRQGALAPTASAEFELAAPWVGKGVFEGLEGFSHVWLLSHFHQNTQTNAPTKIHPPRLLGKSVGVFASRSPHRPNDIGLTLAKLDRVEGDKLFLSAVDLVDGTPILDIKPYLAEADRPKEFTCGWADGLSATEVPCAFSDEAEKQLNQLCAQGLIADREKFVRLTREVLALDPRPLSYRARVNEKFAVVLGGMDVHARHHENAFTVVSVHPYQR